MRLLKTTIRFLAAAALAAIPVAVATVLLAPVEYFVSAEQIAEAPTNTRLAKAPAKNTTNIEFPVATSDIAPELEGVECGAEDFSQCLLGQNELVMPAFHRSRKPAARSVARLKVPTKNKLAELLIARAWAEWDAPAAEASQACDMRTHADDLLVKALDGVESDSDSKAVLSSIDWRIEASQLDTDAALGFQMQRWSMPLEIVGNFQKTDFSPIHNRFKKIRKAGKHLGLFEKAPAAKPLPTLLAEKKKSVAKAPRNKAVAKRVVKEQEFFLPAQPLVLAPKVEVAVAPQTAPQADVSKTEVATKPEAARIAQPRLASADFASGISESLMLRLSEFATGAPVNEEVAQSEAPAPAVENRVQSIEETVVLAPIPDAAISADPVELDAEKEFAAQAAAAEATTGAAEPTAVAMALPAPVISTLSAPVASPGTPAAHKPVLTASATPLSSVVNQNIVPIPPGPRKKAAVSVMSSQSIQAFTREFGTHLEGQVTYDGNVGSFLETNRATLEVFLIPMNETEKTVRIPLLQFPESVFRFDARKMKGGFRVVALALAPDHSQPIGRAVYSPVINADNAKQNIRFHVTASALRSGAIHEVAGRLTVPVTLSIFRGASPEAREPKPIEGARITVAGFPNLGEFVSDADGDVTTLPRFPVHSRLLFIVNAGKEYLPTTQAVSVGTRDPGGRIFLVDRSQAESMSLLLPEDKFASGFETPLAKEFGSLAEALADKVKRFINATTAVIMGRVYDATTREPLPGERVVLQGHDHTRLAYYGPASDVNEPKTQIEGFFSMFKVAHGFRYFERLGKDVRNYRILANAGFGYYVELGKMGDQILQGMVQGFFDRQPIAGTELQVVGDDEVTIANDGAKFQIEGIQHPAGRITMEFRRDGYPMTWHTAPYNPMDRMWPRKYSMLTNDEVNRILFQPGLPKWQETTGLMVGRAMGDLFDIAEDTALKVEVRTTAGKKIPTIHGPFSVNGSDPSIGLTREMSGFAFWNLVPGEYIVVFRKMSNDQIVRIELTDIGRDRVSIVY